MNLTARADARVGVDAPMDGWTDGHKVGISIMSHAKADVIKNIRPHTLF